MILSHQVILAEQIMNASVFFTLCRLHSAGYVIWILKFFLQVRKSHLSTDKNKKEYF